MRTISTRYYRKFDAHFISKKNINHEKVKFHSRREKPAESRTTFTGVLYELAERCDFAEKNEEIKG